jgi:hypothetical protein
MFQKNENKPTKIPTKNIEKSNQKNIHLIYNALSNCVTKSSAGNFVIVGENCDNSTVLHNAVAWS